jgi:plasmid stabilization system protein ParE
MVKWTQPAKCDLKKIYDYIAKEKRMASESPSIGHYINGKQSMSSRCK